jgi:hypothetical protein
MGPRQIGKALQVCLVRKRHSDPRLQWTGWTLWLDDYWVAKVNHEDDTVWRWVIHHYKYDPDRRERRNVIVAAYDNESEFRAEFDRAADKIRVEIAAGNRSNRENLGGVVLEPGHRAAAARGRNVRRAIEHGVNPRPLLSDGPLPHNMALLWFTGDDRAQVVDDE